MTFSEKIDKIKTISKLSLKKLAEKSQLYTTLEKAYSDNREMKDSTTEKFLQNLGINPEWWATGKGEIFLPKEQPQTIISEPGNRAESSADLRKTIAAHEMTIAAMERVVNMQDKLLDEYREQLAECKERLASVKQSR